jgi:hypothetical protein
MLENILHGVHPVAYHNNKKKVFHRHHNNNVLYIYSITLLHVSVPKDHHQVDPQSTKIVIIFANRDPYRCTYVLVIIGGFASYVFFVWVMYVRVVCIFKLCKAIHLLCIIILVCQ